ncbi:MAG: site-specific integrase [Clostridium sp.]|nr:site-specific integrase [Clostridium sp.]
MPRRGTNIYKRKDGRWEGRIKKENAAEGSRKYISVYGKTYREVKCRMEQTKDICTRSDSQAELTLQQAVEIWMKEMEPYWKQTTYTSYYHLAHKYIFPRLGKMRVNQIEESVLEKFLSEIRKDGKELSNRYLRNICGIVLKAMKHMNRKSQYTLKIPENPVRTLTKKQIILPREEELAKLEKYLLENSSDSTCLGILTALYMGLRIGEICALTWGDIDLTEKVIYIRKNLQRVKTDNLSGNSTKILLQEPKTCTSFRIIPIPSVLIPLLQARQEKDENYLIKGKKKPWAESRTLQYRFTRILQQCGLKNFNFHMLRHSFATRCIVNGFDVKSLSEILGHSSVQVTLNLYIHSNMQRKKELMETISTSLYQS